MAGPSRVEDALERDEFRFVPPLNQSPFVPAEAGTQGPRIRPKDWVPASAGTNGIKRRFNSTHLALAEAGCPVREVLDHMITTLERTKLRDAARAPPCRRPCWRRARHDAEENRTFVIAITNLLESLRH